MDKEIKGKFFELTRMKYEEQAKWFLNAFWNAGIQGECESVWKFSQKFIELDSKKKEGNELDEFWSHKFLESLGETLTVISLREKLRQIDMDANGKMALLEYLLFKYAKAPKDVITAPQGENPEELQAAQVRLDAVQLALNDLLKQLEDQQKALAEQRRAEEEVRKSEEDLRQAVQALTSQEQAYQNQLKELERKSTDTGASVVSKSKAAAELAQLKQENPLPLRKAKITQEAALRKVEKERKVAEAATAAAEAQAKHVEASVRETEARYQEAVEALEEVKKKGGVAYGSIWFMEREMKEMQKYLPKRKQN